MKKTIIILFVIAVLVLGGFYLVKIRAPKQAANQEAVMDQNFEIVPIEHATALLKWNGYNIYTDPVGDRKLFAGLPSPDIILITDIHSDHFSTSTLAELVGAKTVLISPEAVTNLLPENLRTKNNALTNGQSMNVGGNDGFKIEAVPMYNIPESPTAFHTKGRGNGYVLEAGDKRVYFSGDTSATPEMKALKNIDLAFVCMSPPYTMGVEEAVQGVLAFKPKEVIPYHYKDSDTNKFKQLVNQGDSKIKVNLMNFYPN